MPAIRVLCRQIDCHTQRQPPLFLVAMRLHRTQSGGYDILVKAYFVGEEASADASHKKNLTRETHPASRELDVDDDRKKPRSISSWRVIWPSVPSARTMHTRSTATNHCCRPKCSTMACAATSNGSRFRPICPAS